MNSLSSAERSGQQQQLGASEERVRQLELQLVKQRCDWEQDAREWQSFRRHQSDLGEWLVDAATNDAGHVVKSPIDAALGGESCLPGTFSISSNGRRYHLALVSTLYEVKET